MFSLKCESCDQVFSRNYNLQRHINSNVCRSGRDQRGLFKCLENCVTHFNTSKDLREHLTVNHNFKMVESCLEFNIFEEFEEWLQNEEKRRNIRFFKTRGVKRSLDNLREKTYLYCSRTGKENVSTEESRQRNERSQGSSKINCGCTSQIIVTKHIPSGKCSVVYHSTHYGHKEEIQHLRVSKLCRKEVSLKLMMSVPANRILDSIRQGIEENLNRDDILTLKDINNIKASYKININEGCRHQDDATSVHLWVKECMSMSSEYSPILLFKPQGENSTDFDLHINDFCLIFMNITQIEIFKKFGSNIICVDGTHGMNAYDFELTTVLVLDEFGEGFPIAFMFSNRKDTYIYKCFFTCIRKAIPGHIFSCNVFMSDITNVYIHAWVAVMGAPNKQLYCSWHVDKAWQQNLSKVRDPEKKKWVYKTLKYLQTCMQEDTFEVDLQAFLELLNNDPETKNMFEYLKNNYFNNRFLWAYCYRKRCGINTNMHLESMHKVIKYIYLEGKKIKRLDKAIYALQKYLRDKTINRIIKLTKGKCSESLTKIKSRHRNAITNPNNIHQTDTNIFETTDENNIKYVVKKIKNGICCALTCKFCNICVHTYECSCLDYSIKSTICKHIHSVNIENENSNIPTRNNNNESQLEVIKLVNNLSENSPSISVSKKSSHKMLCEIKSEALKFVTKIDTLNYTPAEQEFMLSHLKVLNNLGSALSVEETKFNSFSQETLAPSPCNKKIKKQNFFSTKKKRNSKKLMISKPNSTETRIIKGTLSRTLFISDNPINDHLYYKIIKM